MKQNVGQIVKTHPIGLGFVISNIPFVGRPIFPWSRVIYALENTCVTVQMAQRTV
jgi:hypothetical protein